MAELPHIGKHCDAELCHQLDFLPVKCDACKGTFCVKHFSYDAHRCDKAYQKNVQVPVCPLCNQPVPTPKGMSADAQVDIHINNNCAQQPKKRIFTNKCSVKGCKKRELVPFKCVKCAENFCLGHRFEKDHRCTGRSTLSQSALAAIAREKSNTASQIKSDEQLAREMAESMSRRGSYTPDEDRDRRLAQQLAQEEIDRYGRGNSGDGQDPRKNCTIS